MDQFACPLVTSGTDSESEREAAKEGDVFLR